MGKFRFSMTMSLDGYVAGPNQSLDNPLGEGGEDIHAWMHNLRSFHEIQGDNREGETGTNDDVLREAFRNIGATIMGRNMFGPERGPWSAEPWRGWWGENPPYHTPVFVLTHHARQPLVMEGGTTFIFATDGIEAALDQAREAAGDKDVLLGGGASVVQQYLKARLLDEIEVHLVPNLLGDGARLFDNLNGANLKLDPVRTIEGPGVTHIKYRIVK
jgi:dihydrofolate reductase